MRYKKIMVLTIVILACFFAIGAVSAADNATDDVVSVENNGGLDDLGSLVNETVSEIDSEENGDDERLSISEGDGSPVLSSGNLDGISIILWSNDNFYEYSSKGYDIGVWIEDIYYDDSANYYMNLLIYDENNALVFNSTKEVMKSYYYDDMTNFRAKLAGGSYTAVLTASMVSNYGSYKSNSFKYDVYLESKAEYEANLIDDEPDDVYAEPVKINAPSVQVKLNANQYLKVKVTYTSGYPVKNEYIKIKVWTGKKTKTYYVKTNSKGMASFNTKKLSLGTHKVKISMYDTFNFKGTKYTKIVVKKKLSSTAVKTTTPKKTNTATVKNGKYNNKNYFTVTVKDGSKKVKVKCVYKKSYKQYLGSVYKYGKRYSVYIAYEPRNGMQHGKIGWWTSGTNAGLSDYARIDTRYNRYTPVTSLNLH